MAAIADAPMVFVGYGVHAPERGWDDFKGVDLKGKVAVFLVNDPDFVAAKGEDSFGKFGGRTMTYYGRWTYKFEEAARRGAIAALIVHDTDGAGYGWNVVKSPGGENYSLVVPPEKATSLALQGWISGKPRPGCLHPPVRISQSCALPPGARIFVPSTSAPAFGRRFRSRMKSCAVRMSSPKSRAPTVPTRS